MKLSVLVRCARWLGVAAFVLLAGVARAGDKPQPEVVVYTALDQIYSEPIFNAFTQKTGVRVRAVYDSEAAKTVGLVARLRAERARPRCDVFWNNEIIRTIELKDAGLLAPYRSPSAEAIPAAYKDPEGCWTGFAARVRVLAWNPALIKESELPKSIEELTDPPFKGKVGMAYPLFGTTATHAAVLFARWGDEQAKEFFTKLRDNGVSVLEGNMTACRAVADGELALAMTDSDDANLLKSQGKKLEFRPLGHGKDGAALLIPNTVALVKGAPHEAAGKQLIDYLLSPEVEEALAACPSAQIPLREGIKWPPAIKAMLMRDKPFFLGAPPYVEAASKLPVSAPFLKQLFARR